MRNKRIEVKENVSFKKHESFQTRMKDFTHRVHLQVNEDKTECHVWRVHPPGE